ncbi:MAG: M20 family metallo-hydrolase [bacterium]|jgi:allantoate deiminase
MGDILKRISGERLRARLEELGSIGATEKGLMRFSYTPEHTRALNLLRKYMEGAGLQVRVDAAGNLFGRLEGKNPALPVVLTGSHVDAVPHGGIFDGALGIMTAIECMQSFAEAGWRPQRSIEVVAFAEEEPTLFGVGCVGSRFIVDPEYPAKADAWIDGQGRSLSQMLAEWDTERDTSWEVKGPVGGIHSFIEVHIEQGPQLDDMGLPLGIVTGIVGISRMVVDVIGDANHAGTTPMEKRRDALVAAAEIIQWVNRTALASDGNMVATVGKLNIEPGATNVIPGKVQVYAEMRSLQGEMITKFNTDLVAEAQRISRNTGVNVQVGEPKTDWPVYMDEKLVSILQECAAELGIKHVLMPSWAGHDAKIIAKVAPIGMVFIPSIDGISHSPREGINFADATLAAKVLARALTQVASS